MLGTEAGVRRGTWAPQLYEGASSPLVVPQGELARFSCPLPCSCQVPQVNGNLSGGILINTRNESLNLGQLWCGDGRSPVGHHCAGSRAFNTPFAGLRALRLLA